MSSSQVTWSSGRQVIMASSHPVILSSCYLVFLLHVIWSSGHLVIQSSCHPVILCHLVIFVSTLLLTDRHTTSGSTGLLWRQLLIMTSSSTNTSILYFVDPCSLQRGRPCQLGAEEKIRLAGSPWQDCLYKGENCGQGAGGGEEARARAQPGAGGDEGAARGDPDTGDTPGHVTAILASHWSTPWVLRPGELWLVDSCNTDLWLVQTNVGRKPSMELAWPRKMRSDITRTRVIWAEEDDLTSFCPVSLSSLYYALMGYLDTAMATNLALYSFLYSRNLHPILLNIYFII